jgi:hypothetical protein
MNPSDCIIPSKSNPFHENFFKQLQLTGQTGTCPKCGQAGLEERTTGKRGPRYVLHCGSIQNSYRGERLQVVLALIADAKAQQAAEGGEQ